MKTSYIHLCKLFGSIILLLFIFSFSAEAAQAATLTASEQQQLAALSLQLNSLSKLLGILKSSLLSSVSAQTASTTPDTTPPSVPTGLTATAVSSSQINLAWTASTDNVGVTNYSVNRNGTYIYAPPITTVSYSDTGLSAGTSYSYTVVAYDAAGNSAQSAAASATTQSSAGSGCTSLTLSLNKTTFSTNDYVSYTYTCVPSGSVPSVTVQLVKPGGGVDIVAVNYSVTNSYSSNFPTSVYPAGSYTLLVCFGDHANCQSMSNTSASFFIGSGTVDTTPPSTPAGLSATAISSSQINLSWSASTDNVGVTGYKVYRNGTYFAPVTTLFYSDTGLSAGTSYSYTVAAYDAAGNVSAQSSSVSVATPASSTAPPPSPPPSSSTPDTTPPTAPTLSGYAVSTTQISLSWSGATDNIGVTGYKIFRNNTLLTSVTTISYQDNSVAANTSYSYYVKAYDAAGNESGASATASVTTPVSSSLTSITSSYSNPMPDRSVPSLTFVGQITGLYNPAGVNVNPGGSIYIADYHNDNVKVYNSGFLFIKTIGSTRGSASGQFSEPWDIGFDSSGRAFISDTNNNRVQIFDSYGNYVSQISLQQDSHQGVALNSDGYLYVSGRAVEVFTTAGSKVTNFSLSSSDNIYPRNIAIDKNNRVYFSNPDFGGGGNHAITIHTPTGSLIKKIPLSYAPSFIDVDDLFRIWVGDPTNNKIKVYDSGGVFITDFQLPVSSSGNTTIGVEVSGDKLYASIMYDNLVRVYSITNTSSTTTTPLSPSPTPPPPPPPPPSSTSTSTPDTIPPTAPAGLTAVAISPSQIRLSWSVATDNVGVTSYQVFRNNLPWTQVGTTTTYMDTGLTSGASYSYYIKAYDAVGNVSLPSNTVTVSTPTSGLSAPYGLFSTFFSQTATISGTPSAGYVYANNLLYISGSGFSVGTQGVAGYKVFRNNVYVGPTAFGGVMYFDTTVEPLTTYTYYIKAYDAAGNESAASETITATTPSFSGRTITTSITSTTTVISILPPPPPSQTIMFAVDSIQTTPLTGAIGVDSGTRIKVKFTKEFDPVSTIGQFFSLTPAANPSAYVNGTFFMAGDSFEFAPSSALLPNTSYVYTVFTILRDKSGVSLASPFSATFTTAAGASISGGIVEGSVTDPDGRPVANTSIRIYKEDFSANFGTMTAQDGSFNLGIPAGTYFIELYPPPYLPTALKDLVRPAPMRFSIASSERKKLSFQFTVPAKVISGAVTFSNGASVPDAEVGAYSSDTNQWTSALVDISGKFTLRVGGGKWKVGIRPKEPVGAKWSWFGPFPEVEFAKDAVSESKSANFVVPLADIKIVVRAVDDKGAPLSDAGIILDTLSAARTDEISKSPPEFRRSDAKGEVNFTLRAGNYYLRAYLSSARGYLNPEEQPLSVASGESREIQLVFRKRELEKFLSIKGIIKFEDGTPTDAFVWAWSEKGRFFDTHSNTNGEFTIPVSAKDRWHIGAGKLIGTIPHKSSEVIIQVGTDSVSMEIVLVKIHEELPPAVSTSQSATQQVVVQAQDGAKITIPPTAAVPSGTVNVDIKPTVEAPSQAGAAVVSTVYDVTVHDAAGKEVTALTEEAEITIPYDKKELKAKGVSEDAIVPSFLDEKTGSWVKLDNYTIDKDKSVVIARVKHLTRFAIVAAADITPPNPPSAASATALGGGKMKISWVNPAKDFDHAKVYRSQKAGELGEIRAAEVAGTEFTDMDLTDGVTYYYTVRAVDPAGNESGNIEQINLRAVGTSVKAKLPVAEKGKKSIPPGQKIKLEILRNLTARSKGEDVKSLQQLLLNAGVYPEGLITGFFGNLTKQAVIRFQEKYAAEILTPAGLTKGSGFVGALTRKKINQFRLLPTEVK